MSEPKSQVLWGTGAGCLSSVGAYILGTVGQRCMLLKRCRNLRPEHCGAGVQAVSAVSEPTSWALWGTGTGCLRGDETYLPGTVGQMCRLFKRCLNIPPGHCGSGVQAVLAVSEPTMYLPGTLGQGGRLFKRCQNLPPVHCGAGVQDV